MIVSTKGRYALRVMIDLSEHQSEKYVPLKEVAARQEISEKYLENILATLVRANMLSGMRGKGGGYVAKQHKELVRCIKVSSRWELFDVDTPADLILLQKPLGL